MKKNVLLLLLALITVPAWAGDAAQPSTQPAPVTQAAPDNNPLSLTASPRANALKAILEGTIKDAAALGCPTGCTLMNCPPPSGPSVCCKKTAQGYVQC